MSEQAAQAQIDQPVANLPQVQPAVPTGVEKRISQLYGEKMEAQQRAAAMEQQMADLNARLLEAQEQVARLTAYQTPPSSPPSFSPSPVVSSLSGYEGIQKVVEEAIQRSVGPVINELRQQQQVARLRAQQHESYQKACRMFPELVDPASQLFRLVNDILRRDPVLGGEENGIMKAALIAKGALADQGVSPASASLPVQAATIPSTSAAPPLGKTVKQQIVERETEIDKLREEMQYARDPTKLWERRSVLLNEINQLRQKAAETGVE